MRVVFKSSAYPETTMFGNMATKLIKYMGYDGSIPGALGAEIVPIALANVVAEINKELAASKNTEELDQLCLSSDKRAKTLIRLLQAASRKRAAVIWYEG